MYIHCSNKPSLRCLLSSGKWAVVVKERLQPLQSSQAWLQMAIKASPPEPGDGFVPKMLPLILSKFGPFKDRAAVLSLFLLPPLLPDGSNQLCNRWSVHTLYVLTPSRCTGTGLPLLHCFTVHCVQPWGRFNCSIVADFSEV